MNKSTITATLIVKNEEKCLFNCLNSISSIVDEIIVVDTGSTDKTVEIARTFTDKVYFFNWCDNYSLARNEALKYATKDWVLVINADETLDSQSISAIKNYTNILEKEKPYLILFRLKTPKQQDLFVRGLFPNHLNIHFKARVHEFPVCLNQKLIAIEAPNIVLHHSPSYPTDKYEYDKRLLMEDLKQMQHSYERATHLSHLARTELKRGQKNLALNCLEQSLFEYKKSGESKGRRLYRNILDKLVILHIEKESYAQALELSNELKHTFPDFIQPDLFIMQCSFYLGSLKKAKELCHNIFHKTHTENIPSTSKKNIIYTVRLFLSRIAILNKQFSVGLKGLQELEKQRSDEIIRSHLSRCYLLSNNQELAIYWHVRDHTFSHNIIDNIQSLPWWSKNEVIQLKQLIST